MTLDEFKKIAASSGYGCAKTIDKWMKQNPKDEYTEDDFIALYRYHEDYMERFNRRYTSGIWRDTVQGRTTKHYKNSGMDH